MTNQSNQNVPTTSSSLHTQYGVRGMLASRRIRELQPNDVLAGRGGGVNAHPGNRRFREWVAVRREAYTLARSKAAKNEVAREVVQLVQNQQPPGRFLVRDPASPVSAAHNAGTSGWWIELDEDRIMAKTSQALREGAPLIRATHGVSPSHNDAEHGGTTSTPEAKRRRKSITPFTTTASITSSKKRRHPQLSPSETSSMTFPFHPGATLVEAGHVTLSPTRHSSSSEGDAALLRYQSNTTLETISPSSSFNSFVRHPSSVRLSHGEDDDHLNHQDDLCSNHAQLFPPASSAKRVRLDYKGRMVYPSEKPSPKLAPRTILPDDDDEGKKNESTFSAVVLSPSATGVPDLHALAPPIPSFHAGGMRRSHSLALSDVSSGDFGGIGEFVNPFEEEEDDKLLTEDHSVLAEEESHRIAPTFPCVNNNDSHSTSLLETWRTPQPLPFTSGLPPPLLSSDRHRNSTQSLSDLGSIGALLRASSSSSSNRNHSNNISKSSMDPPSARYEFHNNKMDRFVYDSLFAKDQGMKNKDNIRSSNDGSDDDPRIRYVNDILNGRSTPPNYPPMTQ